jgi:amidophosphoribosyltransferase
LIAATHSRQEIASYLGVDSLEYLTLDEMVAATQANADWCHACFSGDYPTPVPEDTVLHRHPSTPEAVLR